MHQKLKFLQQQQKLTNQLIESNHLLTEHINKFNTTLQTNFDPLNNAITNLVEKLDDSAQKPTSLSQHNSLHHSSVFAKVTPDILDQIVAPITICCLSDEASVNSHLSFYQLNKNSPIPRYTYDYDNVG